MMDLRRWHYAVEIRGTEEFTLRILQEYFRQSLGSVFLKWILYQMSTVERGSRGEWQDCDLGFLMFIT